MVFLQNDKFCPFCSGVEALLFQPRCYRATWLTGLFYSGVVVLRLIYDTCQIVIDFDRRSTGNILLEIVLFLHEISLLLYDNPLFF